MTFYDGPLLPPNRSGSWRRRTIIDPCWDLDVPFVLCVHREAFQLLPAYVKRISRSYMQLYRALGSFTLK